MSCTENNILEREGSSHLNRVLAALSPGYAKPDERDTADILLFAKRYAAYLNYYNESDTEDGSWEALMMMDISVILATLVKTDTRVVADYKKLLYKKIQMAGTEAEAKLTFRFLFDLIFSLVKTIDDQYKLVPANLEFKILFKNVIEVKMQEAFLKLHSLFNNFKTAGWIDFVLTDLDSDAPIPVTNAADFNLNELSAEWRTLTPGTIITLPAFADVKDNIVHIINHNLFNAQIETVWKGITEIVTNASKLFEETLTEFPSHTSHYALFLSFVKIFKHAQDHLNGYTQRHLDFYYKDVLQLKNKPAEADTAHVVFELQKPVSKHLLKKDILIKGGKDSTGKEVSYALTDDIVLNKASVAVIQSQQLLPNTGILIASPVAASDDGQGAELKSIDKSWFTFGDINKANLAETGFAIASNLLFLKEGTRTIFITVRFQDKIQKLVANPKTSVKCFSARLTGEKAWHEIAQADLYVQTPDTFLFRLRLSPDDPAIIPYTEAVHKENFREGLPLVQFFLQQDAPGALTYTQLHDKKIKSVSVSVIANGVNDLMLSNDMGAIDASKPFKPFGDFPANEASFYIGSKEIFQKNLDWITINPEWEIRNGPGETKPALLNAKYLNQSNWATSYPINNNRISFNTPGAFAKTAVDFEKNESLRANTREGFLRVQLNSSDYSLPTHMGKIQTQLNSISLTETSEGTMNFNSAVAPPVAAEIFINEFSVDYSATAVISFDASDETANNLFYHVTPFGYEQVHPLLVDKENNTEASEKITLLQHIIHEGELFIGFEQAAPNLVLNVLFQVADGSSNPLKNMEPVSWFYLSHNNNWKAFEKQFIIDCTKNLTQPGIVTITLPEDINSNITTFQKGLHWIKAAVKHNCDAVCKMISIQAQAVQVKLVQDEIKEIEFREARPASSISKLIVADAAIKKITQPFDSFNGRTRETDDHFYLRVSERLRHKQRAITIWDYEHIILEKFPEIFKVRCINHSGFYFKGDEEVFCENYPGHVTIITVPVQQNKTNINPLRPYTSIGLLQNINDYLATIISPFVKLHVKNPAFEEIQLDFEVKFYDNLDEAFYLQLLNNEIERFLCPWGYDTQAEISFGGKIRKSAILNFIEERHYVDYVTCFKMNQVIRRNGSVHIEEKTDIEVAERTTSRSLLVSYYNEQTGVKHHIQSPATCNC
jgi:hypothetical protein